MNDWYDRHVDAINEPARPIPSGRIPGDWGFLDRRRVDGDLALILRAARCVVFAAASLGLALSWAYSAPPLRPETKRLAWPRALSRFRMKASHGSPALRL